MKSPFHKGIPIEKSDIQMGNKLLYTSKESYLLGKGEEWKNIDEDLPGMDANNALLQGSYLNWVSDFFLKNG